MPKISLTVVEIADEPVEPGRPYTDKKTNLQKMTSARQTVYFHQGDRYPLKSEIDVDDVSGPYRPGFYMLAGAPFEIAGTTTGYTKLGFNPRKLHLIPAADAVADLTANYLPKTAKAA